MRTNCITHWLKQTLVSALLLIGLTMITYQSAWAAADWYVVPGGAGTRSGQTWENAFAAIQPALDAAQPGDTIHLGAGDYFEDLVTKRHGAANGPITITGPREAVVRGASGGRIFQIFHDYYRLEGWTINGHDGKGNSAANYRDKLLYVHGQAAAYGGEVRRGPRGLEVTGMLLTNAGGECIRLRYFVQNANIHHNTITNCGRYDFVFGAGGKNGEGIYIGTSSNQWGDGKNPTNEPDITANNHIHHNLINTQANECAEAKEGATGNIIEYNDCTGGKDPEAAGLAARGDGNIFRYNTSYGHAGGAIRFGGHVMNGHQYGVSNEAYGNIFYGNALGGIKFEINNQRLICGNLLAGPTGQTQANPAFGSFGSEYAMQVSAACQDQPVVLPTATPVIPPTAIPVIPPTATPVVPPTATPAVPPTATPVAPPTATPVIPPTATPVLPPTATPGTPPTVAPSPTPLPTTPAIPTVPPPTPTPLPTSEPVVVTGNQTIYFSPVAEDRIGNLRFMDEDIIAFDQTTQQWQLYFDGSDVGLTRADVDALALLPDGSLLLSFITATDTPGLGQVDDSDLVRFVPERVGPTTAGRFELYFDGSDVGLSKDSEDIDALAVLRDGSLLMSTTGLHIVPDVVGSDTDLILFRPQVLGNETAGGWSPYFTGVTHGFQPSSAEDINGVWLDEQNSSSPNLYLNTRGQFAAHQLTGDNEDLFICPLRAVTPCALLGYWHGEQHDFAGDNIDAFDIGGAVAFPTVVTAADAAEGDAGLADDVEPAEEARNNDSEQLRDQLFLPVIGW